MQRVSFKESTFQKKRINKVFMGHNIKFFLQELSKIFESICSNFQLNLLITCELWTDLRIRLYIISSIYLALCI